MPKTRYEINHSDVPIRLFQSDFLEFFTHISPLAVLALYLPVVGYFLWKAAVEAPGGGLWVLPAGFLFGMLIWTLTEYLMHRFVFHFHPRDASARVERIIFLFHGVHHAQPQLKTRLVMPPAVSIPLALAFYFLFRALFIWLGLESWLAPTFAGAVFGYLCYDMIHYATHHFPMRWGPLKFLRRYHMQHHFKTEDARFGVSSPLWDLVFRTLPAES